MVEGGNTDRGGGEDVSVNRKLRTGLYEVRSNTMSYR